MLAAVSGHLSTVSALLEAGAGELSLQPPPPQVVRCPKATGAKPGAPAAKAAKPAAKTGKPGQKKPTAGAANKVARPGVAAGARAPKAAKKKAPAAPAPVPAPAPSPGPAPATVTATVAADGPGLASLALPPPPALRCCPGASLGPVQTATLAAAVHGNNSVLRLLLDRGVSLDIQLPDIGELLQRSGVRGGHTNMGHT